MHGILQVDRGNVVEQRQEHLPAWVAASRLGSLKVSGQSVTLWFQMHGSSRIDAREGSFHLCRGDWMLLERESQPLLQVQRNALTLGITIPADSWDRMARRFPSQEIPLPGRDHLHASHRRMALRLWRQGANAHKDDAHRQRCLETLLRHLASMQPEVGALAARYPRRSLQRQRQLLMRMQRARLFLEGNSHRVVRLSELADLTNLSIWHFAKTYQALYSESPLASGKRMRLERARRMLLATSYSIAEVGRACGFENNCGFSRAFRAWYGTTPSAIKANAESVPGEGSVPMAATFRGH
ncbi:MAG: AraC family transcriptional regulator [Luteimonas sp.]|nr:AraC family transcriptional regulator [Luteimonas sp.]